MSSDRREVWATLSRLLQRVEAGQTSTAVPDLNGLKDEVRKLGKTQFKANTLAETQAARWQNALAEMEAVQAENRDLLQQLQAQRQASADRDLLLSLLPVLDDLEQALAHGRAHLAQAENEALRGWLEGVRLTYERLLATLERNGVKPIPSVGRPFDPYRHRVVGTTHTPPRGETAVPPGGIVAEERRGYQGPSGVLRYADVIVYKPDKG